MISWEGLSRVWCSHCLHMNKTNWPCRLGGYYSNLKNLPPYWLMWCSIYFESFSRSTKNIGLVLVSLCVSDINSKSPTSVSRSRILPTTHLFASIPIRLDGVGFKYVCGRETLAFFYLKPNVDELDNWGVSLPVVLLSSPFCLLSSKIIQNSFYLLTLL